MPAVRVVGIALVIALGSAPLSAQAADDEEAKKEEAFKYYQEGEELFNKELYDAAVRMFKKAYDTFAHHSITYNIAKSYEKLGVADECVTHFERYIEEYRKAEKKEPPDIFDIKNSIAKCKMGARLEISIDSEPEGASVYIDNKEKLLGQTPFKSRLDPGEYTLFLDMSGFQPFEKTFMVRKGEAQSFTFKLERIKRTGLVQLKANIKGASVFIDGRNIGLTPYEQKIVLEEGVHQVTIDKDEYEPFSREMKVVTNEEYNIQAELWLRDAPYTWKGVVGWIMTGLGTAMVAGGFVAGSFAEEEFADTPDFNDLANLQKIGYIGGGSAAGIGIILLIAEAFDTKHVKEGDVLSGTLPRPDFLADGDGQPTIEPIVLPTAAGAVVGADVRF